MSRGLGIRQREVLNVLRQDPFGCGWLFLSDSTKGAEKSRYKALRRAVHQLEMTGSVRSWNVYFAGRERVIVARPYTRVFIVDRLTGDPDLPPEW